MSFNDLNRQYENIQHDRESRRLEANEDAAEVLNAGVLELADRLEQTPGEMLLQQDRGGAV